MRFRAVLFDVYGTLVDINTDEGREEIYRGLAAILTYQGIDLQWGEVRDQYFSIMKEQRRRRGWSHPEFDVVEVFREMIHRSAGDFTRSMEEAKRTHLPLFLAEAYRALSRNRLALYPGVREVLEGLRARYRLAALSDAQRVWLLPELQAVGLQDLFDPLVVSSDRGYRKPDGRLFGEALAEMGLEPGEVLFVGNDMYRDVWGGQRAGLKVIFFSSNQGEKEKKGVVPEGVVTSFPDLPAAIEELERA